MSALTVAFEGHDLHFTTFRGHPCITAKELGQALGYTGKSLSNRVREWADELIEGKDFAVLRDDDRREFLDGFDVVTKSVTSRAGAITVFFESGFDMVCTKTEKPLGKKLRRFLVEHVLPKLRRGEAIGGMGGVTELRVLEIITAATAPMMQAIELLVARLGQPTPAPASAGPFIGKRSAEMHILEPLRLYVALKAWSLNIPPEEKSKRRSIRTRAEGELRKEMGFARHFGAKWECLPASRLATVIDRMQAMVHDVRQDLAAQGKPETPNSELPLFMHAHKNHGKDGAN